MWIRSINECVVFNEVMIHPKLESETCFLPSSLNVKRVFAQVYLAFKNISNTRAAGFVFRRDNIDKLHIYKMATIIKYNVQYKTICK